MSTRDVEEQVNISNLLDVAFDAVLSSGHFDIETIASGSRSYARPEAVFFVAWSVNIELK